MDFAAWIETWRRVLTQPGEPVFEQEKMNPNASLQTALIWMVIAGVVAAIFGVISSAIGLSSMTAMLSQLDEMPPEFQQQMGTMLSMATGSMGFGAILLVPLGFLIGTFIIHLIAKMLGGQGEYSTYAYLAATYQAPLTMASSIVAIVPFLGGCISFLIFIYSYVEGYFAVKANYGLTSGRAVATILIPLVVAVILGACIAFLFAGMIMALVGNS